VLSCEHGGNRVPSRYASLFARARGVLETHRAYDRGALPLARALSRRLRAPLHAARITRLLVDLNRTSRHPACFSRYSAPLDRAQRDELLARFYTPHRAAIDARIGASTRAGRRVLHLAVHSFTPVLRGEVRNADLGLLYDPRRPGERALCAAWSRALRAADPSLRVRLNYPYRGSSDGLTTALRKRYPDAEYLGVELEVNQRLFERRALAQLARLIAASVAQQIDA